MNNKILKHLWKIAKPAELDIYDFDLFYNGFVADYCYTEEDGVWHGKLENTTDLVLFEADTETEIESSFHNAVDGYIEMCANIGKKPIMFGNFKE